jgi:hypothetical protein
MGKCHLVTFMLSYFTTWPYDIQSDKDYVQETHVPFEGMV